MKYLILIISIILFNCAERLMDQNKEDYNQNSQFCFYDCKDSCQWVKVDTNNLSCEKLNNGKSFFYGNILGYPDTLKDTIFQVACYPYAKDSTKIIVFGNPNFDPEIRMYFDDIESCENIEGLGNCVEFEQFDYIYDFKPVIVDTVIYWE